MDPLFAPASVPRRRKQNVLLLIAAIAFVSVGIVLLKRDNTNGTTTTTTSGAGAGAGHTSVEQDGNDQFLPGLDQAREQQHHPQASLEFEPEETEKEYNLSKDDNQGYHAEDQVGQEEVAAETTPSSSSSSSSSEQERDPLDTAPILPDTTEQDIITETLEEEASDPNFVGVDANLLAEEENLLQEEEAMIPTEEDLDGSIMNETVVEIPELEYDRNLAEDHDDHANHMPLMCNANLSTASCAANGFSSLLGGNNDTVTVPCGQCYTMDITDGSTVELPTGLAIEGKLYFPPEASVTIKTKFVWVLGLLKMDTPAVDNLVKFHMVGDDLQTYTSSGMGPCSAMNGGCNQGSKVIAVHGGQLDIQGIESTCPSWEKLTNVGEGSLRPFDLPCDGGSCWDSDVMELTGNCAHSQGHSDKIGKYTVRTLLLLLLLLGLIRNTKKNSSTYSARSIAIHLYIGALSFEEQGSAYWKRIFQRNQINQRWTRSFCLSGRQYSNTVLGTQWQLWTSRSYRFIGQMYGVLSYQTHGRYWIWIWWRVDVQECQGGT